MHLIESYATNCGLQIGEPFIYEKYFPIPVDKFIVIQPYSKQSKNYDLWHDVIEMIFPPLKEAGYTIIQIGAKGEQALPGCVNLAGNTDINQSAFIIRKSKLLLGADSFGAHIASYFNSKGHGNKIVSLYSNNNVNNVKPYFGNQKDYILLEPVRNNYKPSYSLEENPKTINLIKLETVAKAVLDLLDLSHAAPKIKTIHVGSNYNNKIIECVPNQIIDPKQLGVDRVVIRADLAPVLNLNVVAQQLSVCPNILYLNSPVPKEFLQGMKSRISQIVYRLDYNENSVSNFSPEFVQALSRSGINFSVLSYLNSEDFEAAKFSCMEFAILYDARPSIPEHVLNAKNTFYKTSKLILSNGKVYPSVYAYKKDNPSPKFGFSAFPIDSYMLQDKTWAEDFSQFLIFENLA